MKTYYDKDTKKDFVINSVKNINDEMTKFQQGAADLATRLSILVAGPLTLLFKTLNLISVSANKASEVLTTTDAKQEQKQKLQEDQKREKFLLGELAKAEKRLENAGFSVNEEMLANIAIRTIKDQLKLVTESINKNKRLLEIRELQRNVLLAEGRLLEGQIEL